MLKPDKNLIPDWDEDNINHISIHGLRPEQVEEVYYSEGPFPALAVKQKKKGGKSNIDTVFGVLTLLEPVSKLSWLRIPSMGFGAA